jgi:hypothetical protein
MNKILVSDLKKVRNLIERTDLCKRAFARDKDGDVVPFASSRATSFCLHGAILRAAKQPNAVENFLCSRYGNFARLNDQPGTTKDQILTFLDLTINEVGTLQ